MEKASRKHIKELYTKKNMLKKDIFNIINTSGRYGTDKNKIWRCIQRILIQETKTKYPSKHFSTEKHDNIIRTLSKHMPHKVFEQRCEPIVLDILINYENFEKIRSANMSCGFSNPPFDFFTIRNNTPYIIEFKGSLGGYNISSKWQRQRQKLIVKELCVIKVGLLQVDLSGTYRILIDEEIDDNYPGYELPLEPILQWIHTQIDSQEGSEY
jgi:hypothetical protein